MASGMTKTELVRHLAEKHRIPNKTAAAFLEHLGDTAIKETKKNGVFVLPGIGRMVRANRRTRSGRSSKRGEEIKIPAKTLVEFRIARSAGEDLEKSSEGNKVAGSQNKVATKRRSRRSKSARKTQIVVAGPSFSNALKSLEKLY